MPGSPALSVPAQLITRNRCSGSLVSCICFPASFLGVVTFCAGCCAENLPYLTANTNLDEPENFQNGEFEYMNMPAIYILSCLANSQSMGMIGSAFKTLKAASTIMQKKFPMVHGPAVDVEGVSEVPYITRNTFAYAFALTIQAVCYSANDPTIKTRSEEVYEKALRDFEQLDDDKFNDLVAWYIFNFVKRVISPEPAGPGAVGLSRQAIASKNRTCAAASNTNDSVPAPASASAAASAAASTSAADSATAPASASSAAAGPSAAKGRGRAAEPAAAPAAVATPAAPAVATAADDTAAAAPTIGGGDDDHANDDDGSTGKDKSKGKDNNKSSSAEDEEDKEEEAEEGAPSASQASSSSPGKKDAAKPTKPAPARGGGRGGRPATRGRSKP